MRYIVIAFTEENITLNLLAKGETLPSELKGTILCSSKEITDIINMLEDTIIEERNGQNT